MSQDLDKYTIPWEKEYDDGLFKISLKIYNHKISYSIYNRVTRETRVAVESHEKTLEYLRVNCGLRLNKFNFNLERQTV